LFATPHATVIFCEMLMKLQQIKAEEHENSRATLACSRQLHSDGQRDGLTA